MFDHDIRVDSAAHVELGTQTQKARVEQVDQGVGQLVGHGFMKGAPITKGPQIKLERLELDATLVGDVVEVQRGEIRLPGLWAQAGELRHSHLDQVVTIRIGVREGVQIGAGGAGHGVRL